MRLKELLGVSLEELKTLLSAEEARAEVRAQLRRDDVDAARRRELLDEALGHIDRQLELVRHRAARARQARARAGRDAQARAAQDPRAGCGRFELRGILARDSAASEERDGVSSSHARAITQRKELSRA